MLVDGIDADRVWPTRIPCVDGKLWSVRPPLLSDELLSSWLVRSAHRNGIRPYVFCSAVWGRKAVWTRDVDWIGDAGLTAELARQTAVSNARARASTLRDFEGRVFFEHRLNHKTPWILPIGVFHRLRKNHGLQFCSLCLREDGADAYFRRWWRLGFTTCCARHGVILLDACPKCDAPLSPHRVALNETSVSIARCASCNRDLTDAVSPPADPRVVAFQSHLQRVTRVGYAHLQGRALYGPAYFAVIHQLTRLLATGRASERLRSAVGKLLDLRLSAPFFYRPAREVEQLRTPDRHGLFRGVAELASDWPRTFVEVCHQERIWSAAVLKDMSEQPFFFRAPVMEKLYRASYSSTEGGPRSSWLALAGKGCPRSASGGPADDLE